MAQAFRSSVLPLICAAIAVACFGFAMVDARFRWEWHIGAATLGCALFCWAIYLPWRNSRRHAGTETALQEANARLQGLLDGATQVAIIASDLEGRITVFNTGAERMLGYSAAAVVGQLSLSSLHVESELDQRAEQLSAELGTPVSGFDVLVEQVRRKGHEVREWTYVRNDGSHLIVNLALTAIRAAGGTVSGFVAVATDISDRKRAEADLLQAIQAAEVATRAKSDFLATMSHEIRTPMNGVIGMTRLLLASPLSGQQRECAEVIHSSGEALLGIINDVLDFSKIEAGKLDLDVVDFDLGALLDEVIELFAEEAAAKQLRIDASIDAAVPSRLRGDARRIRQILTNLISNAVKFTDRGAVHIGVSREPRRAGDIVLRFEIADTGVGLDSDARQWLFKAFSQGDPTTTRKYGGTGLGLAICSRLVHMMGGDIGVESDLGRGSTFWFTLHLDRQVSKLAPVDAAKPSATVAAPNGNRRAAHILVAEDNRTNQRVATYMLEKLGYSSQTVASGSEALAAVANSRFDAILMDCHMPQMDGFEATTRIRAAGRAGNRIPIIAMTANALAGDRERCLQAGMDDYLAKPVAMDRLQEVLARWLPSPAGTASPGPAPTELIAHFGGDRRLLHDVSGVFLEDAPRLLADVSAALSAGDVAKLKRATHTLKGALGNFGESAALRLTVELENAARSDDIPAARQLFPAVEAASSALCKTLHATCAELAAAS